MKVVTIFFFTCFFFLSKAQEEAGFNRYFTDRTLRIDYLHTGDATSELITIDKIYRQGPWAGNPEKCIQPQNLGTYMVKVYDVATNQLIFARGYSSIFAEYQTVGPAIRGTKRAFHESVLIPGPKQKFLLVIEKRDRYNIPVPVFSEAIDPADYHINTESFLRNGDEIVQSVNNGSPHYKVDMVILGEGYQADEKEKFKNDLKYYTSLFFSIEPYKSRSALFNITGIFCASEESGTDEPRQGIFRNTRFGSSFNALDLDRYCLDEDNKSIRDAAANVPYDIILIMVNKDRYGGGGIYNWQTVFCTGSAWRDYVFLHEFGHAFAGLGDEYYSSPVSYEDFYTPGVEPLDPNITSLPDPDNVKWKQYLSPGIKVPTDWGKATFDSLNHQILDLNTEHQKTAELLKNTKGSSGELENLDKKYQVKLDGLNRQLNDFINNHPLKDKVGVFEGGNYMSKGFYRPTIMSLMHKFSEGRNDFGIVNEQAVISTIEYYTEQNKK